MLTPSSIFDSNKSDDTRKPISLECDERIDKNSTIDVEEDSSAIASDMKNTLNHVEISTAKPSLKALTMPSNG